MEFRSGVVYVCSSYSSVVVTPHSQKKPVRCEEFVSELIEIAAQVQIT